MEKEKIIKLVEKKYNLENLDILKNILNKNYLISFGSYEPEEIIKVLHEKNPVIIKNNLIIGYKNGKFENEKDEKFPIERMVKAIIVEDEKELVQAEENRPLFAIIGKNQWEEQPVGFNSILGNLRIGEVWLPPHSAIFNFLNPSKDEKKEKIVSELAGVQVNIYSPDNFVDNAIHEIGHLFWRTCLNGKERKAFKNLFNNLKPSAIYEYKWESENEEEVFCTIYKWFVKSILLNKSFYNILEFEEPKGLALFQGVLERVSQDRINQDIWDLNQDKIMDYLRPKFDIKSGQFMRKAGALDEIKDIIVPAEILNNINRFENGVIYVDLDKATVPVKGNRIDYEDMQKATGKEKPVIFFDMDGVVADFAGQYKKLFGRSAYEDDPFTVNQMCMTVPDFFRYLPVLEKGRELFNELDNKYKIVFLTTPMPGMDSCKRDKIDWIKENFGDYDVYFNDNKAQFVTDEKSILIDDMPYNLEPWRDAGGTAINFNKPNDKINQTIEDVFEPIIKKQELKVIKINKNPTEKEKESGKYLKGKIKINKLDIRIENIPGSIRWGNGFDGRRWISKMHDYYGYITGTEGTDYDPVDVFINPEGVNRSLVFAINQAKPDGTFDEIKFMIGYENEEEARQAYLRNYQKGWEKNIMSIIRSNTKKLRDWIKQGQRFDPFK